MNRVTLFLFLVYLLQSDIYGQSRINDYNVGVSYGWAKYYEKWNSSQPENIDLNSDGFDTPDIRYIKVGIELDFDNNISCHLGIGYKEFWNGFFVQDSILGKIGFYSQNGAYTLFDMALSYPFSYKNFEVKPFLGSSHFYISALTYYEKELGFGDEIMIGPIKTTQTTNYFLTIDGGLNCRYWLKRIGIGVNWHYSQGVMKMNKTEGDFDWEGDPGSIEGFSRGTHSTIEMQLLYKFKKNKK